LRLSLTSQLLSPSERRYSTYEKECLAVLFGCGRCHCYLEHKEFELECDNLSLCWPLRRTKDVGRLGRLVLRLAPFKFKVRHTRGVDNVVADALSRMFEGQSDTSPEIACASLLEGLPLVYSFLQRYQGEDQFCETVKESILKKQPGFDSYSVHNGLLSYRPKSAPRRRWVVPIALRAMLLNCFYNSMLSGHLGAFKTFRRITANFWWPRMRTDVFQYVRICDSCQRAIPVQNASVGLHSASPTSKLLERVFIDYVGPLPRTRQGNVAILNVLAGFSKFVNFFTVRKMSSAVAVDCLEKTYFPAFGTPAQLVSDSEKAFRCKVFKDLCFRWGIQHITTTPYYPRGSLAERVNHNLKSALKIYHSEAQDGM
jgi:hypothetical protein